MSSGQDVRDYLAKLAYEANPGSDLERWKNCCMDVLLLNLAEHGYEVSIIIGDLTDAGSITVAHLQ